jgi:hypothetical protein
MEIAGAREASIITMNGHVRAQALRLIEVEKIPIAGFAREVLVTTGEFIEFLGGGRKPPEFVARIREFIADRVSIRSILSQVSNDLRGNVGAKLIATVGRIAINMRDASDEEERQELCDHLMLYVQDIEWLFEIMAKDQTIRSALKPGDRVVVVKSGGRTVRSNG